MRGAGFAYSFLGMRKLVYILFVSMLLLSGCFGKGGIDNQLNAVDGLLGNYPDSAMSVLVGMDTASMSDFQKDRRVLLYAYLSMIYGNPVNLDEENVRSGDSVFNGTFTGDEVKWLVIKSDDAKHRGDFVARIEYLKDAEFLAIQLDTKFDLAIIYQYLANVYAQGFNGTVSKYYADKSVALFRELGCPKQLRESRMAVAGALAAKRDYKSMLDSLEAMKEEVMANAPDHYRRYFLDQLARGYDEDGQTAKAIGIFHELYDGEDVSANTLAHWARAYWRVGELDSAYLFIQRANSLAHNATDEYLCRNVEYGILEKMGRRSELAMVAGLREQASERIMEERELEESSLALNVKYDAAARKAWLEAAESRTRTYVAIFVAALLAIVAAGVYLYLRKRNQLLVLEHENDVLRIRTLQNNLFESDSRQKDVASKISELFNTRFKLIDALAASYFECRETGQEQKRIYSDVKNSISDFSSDSSTQELEDIANAYNDNLMSRFREDFPSLSKAQYRLALYIFCGFSLPSISIFTGSDLRNIYVYKSRLKGVINKSDCARKEDYLAYFR